MSAVCEYDIRFIDTSEWDEAMTMVYRTFLEFDAVMFTPEGIGHFRDFISDTALKRSFDNGAFQVVGAYYGPRIVGVIALRNDSHISLLFVDKNHQNRGIGRRLVSVLSDYAAIKLHQSSMTVNSSPYATDFYHKLGFTDVGPQTLKDGIIYTPMCISIG